MRSKTTKPTNITLKAYISLTPRWLWKISGSPAASAPTAAAPVEAMPYTANRSVRLSSAAASARLACSRG